MRQILPGERQAGRAVSTLNRATPGNGGFYCVAGAPHRHIGNQPQACGVLYRLVRRTIFAEPNGVVREDKDLTNFHECRHAQSVARIVGEHQERGAIGDQASVQCEPVTQRRHRKFAHPKINVVASSIVPGDAFGSRPQSEVGSREIC